MVAWTLKELDGRFDELYDEGDTNQTFAEHQLPRLLLQMLCTVRSEPMLMVQLDYNLPFRWFVGLGRQTRSCCTRGSTGRSGHGYWKAWWPRPMEAGAVHSLTSVWQTNIVPTTRTGRLWVRDEAEWRALIVVKAPICVLGRLLALFQRFDIDLNIGGPIRVKRRR